MFMAYMGWGQGANWASIEAQINILKLATLLDEINGQPLTKELILRSIHRLNGRCDGILGTMCNTVEVVAKDPRTVACISVYYEDSTGALSLQTAGVHFRAIKAPDNTKMLPMSEVQLLVCFAASFRRLESIEVSGLQPAQKKAYWKMYENNEKFQQNYGGIFDKPSAP